MVSQTLLDEAYPIIQRIATIRRKNGAFAYYTGDDVSQEVWLMCLDAVERYDPSIGPLENYLVSHVSNRLKNLKRDKYFRPGSDVETSGHAHVRINLINALPLDSGNADSGGVVLGSSSIDADPLGRAICNETLEYLRSNLSGELLVAFDNLVSGNKVRKALIDSVRTEVARLLTERDSYG